MQNRNMLKEKFCNVSKLLLFIVDFTVFSLKKYLQYFGDQSIGKILT